MRLDNRGITLVELIIAIAVSTIIFGAAMIFMTSAHRGFNIASTEINLQTETQVLTEQISEWVMEGNKIEVDVASKKLTVYRLDSVSIGSTASKRVIWLGSGGDKLYMKRFTGVDKAELDTKIVTSADEKIENCIGEYVVDFTPGYNAADNDKVTISMKLKVGTNEHIVNETFKVRNAIVKGIPFLDWRKAV